MISLSEDAALEIRSALSRLGADGCGLKVQIVGGGCEGFLYDLLYVDGPEEDDQSFESHGIRLFVGRRAIPAVRGLTIDYAATPHGRGFVFQNPSARTQCSCGASFGT